MSTDSPIDVGAEMPNRQQRRHPPKDPPQGVHQILTRLPEPIESGELSVKEVAEVKARNDELKYNADAIERARAELQHLTRVNTLLSNEKSEFIREVCRNHGLDPAVAEFNLDLEGGRILKMAELREVKPLAAVEEVAPEEE